MPSLVPIRRALLSVSDKTDLVPFARALTDLGVEIISTGGTAKALDEAGVAVIRVGDVTGFPEMMDGRVKTLHPAVHGALLARRDDPKHVEALTTHAITPIDLVCVNLYPFERTIAAEGVSRPEAIEQIDIGGPSMLRSAAKNHEFVTVATSPDQYDHIIAELRQHDGATTLALRQTLAAAAFMRTAAYDTAISAWMCGRREQSFPSLLRLTYALSEQLRYGENPHQAGAVYDDPAWSGPSVVKAEQLHGKPLSYNNLNDADAALDLVIDLHQIAGERPAAAVIKHTNPCGAAIAESNGAAFEGAYAGDPLAAFGGILAMSGEIDETVAAALCDGQRFLEVIIAPSITEGAQRMLGERWKNVRLLATGPLRQNRGHDFSYRSVRGGMLVQESDSALTRPREWAHVAGPAPTDETLDAAAFAWTVGKHLKSNAVCITAGRRLLGAGAGQMDRVTSCRIAVEKAGSRIEDANAPVVAASDAFFPFADGPQVLVSAGVTCIIQPGGSKRDDDTIELCRERDVTLLMTGVRHFRH